MALRYVCSVGCAETTAAGAPLSSAQFAQDSAVAQKGHCAVCPPRVLKKPEEVLNALDLLKTTVDFGCAALSLS